MKNYKDHSAILARARKHSSKMNRVAKRAAKIFQSAADEYGDKERLFDQHSEPIQALRDFWSRYWHRKNPRPGYWRKRSSRLHKNPPIE